MAFELREYQIQALKSMRNGCILNGSVGTGKSVTALAYFYVKVCGGSLDAMTRPKQIPLYIITTATKRDKKEWPLECIIFGLEDGKDVTIDSWNNIGKYVTVAGAFFIFDEQRVTGNGPWVKSFLSIAKKNKWILLSATPGDNFLDYCPVFIANGFYRNRTDFIRQHVVYKNFVKYRAVDHYVNVKKLYYFRDKLLVPMESDRSIEHHHFDVIAPYSRIVYKDMMKRRWNIYKDEPFVNAAELCYALRKLCNSDERRVIMVGDLIKQHQKVIIFYNFTYEAELLISLCKRIGVPVARWDGVKHEPIPNTTAWAYILQYAAGDSGWNCIETDTIIFYSQNYSYKSTVQAAGRIDRMNTPYTDLYYYHVRSNSPIDNAIHRALAQKKEFNEKRYFKKF